MLLKLNNEPERRTELRVRGILEPYSKQLQLEQIELSMQPSADFLEVDIVLSSDYVMPVKVTQPQDAHFWLEVILKERNAYLMLIHRDELLYLAVGGCRNHIFGKLHLIGILHVWLGTCEPSLLVAKW